MFVGPRYPMIAVKKNIFSNILIQVVPHLQSSDLINSTLFDLVCKHGIFIIRFNYSFCLYSFIIYILVFYSFKIVFLSHIIYILILF